MPKSLADLWRRGAVFLGTQHAILGGAMSWLSESTLVAALSEAGAFGVLASGNMPPELFREEIRETKRKTGRPFGVNLITLNPKLDDLIHVTVDEGVTHCILAGGVPDRVSISVLKEAGVKVIAFAPVPALAKRLVRQGVDALIVEGHEAGGHVGPVATGVLLQQMLPVIQQVPLFVAGGIGTGEMMASYLVMGAAGCQLGTRFVCASECVAHENFKKSFIRSNSRDAVVTPQFDPVLPVIPVRALENRGTEAFRALQLDLVHAVKSGEKHREEAILELELFWVDALRKAAIEGDVVDGSVMAGQSVGLVRKVEPVSVIIEDLICGAEAQLASLFSS